jgi:hypothetical protein
MDTATSSAVLARTWSLLSGPVTLIMIVRFLSPEEQGYLGIFESIVAIRIFMELGLSTVLMQFIAHERGSLKLDRKTGLSGEKNHLLKVASLLKTASKWYLLMSLILFFAIWITGRYYFSRTNGDHSNIHWEIPLLLISINTALSLLMQPFFGVLEGMGKIAEFFIVGLASAVLMSLSLWISLAMNLDLLAMPIAAFMGLIPAVVCIFRWRHLFKKLLTTVVLDGEGISWMKEVLPLQMKTAFTAVLGYFIFNLTLPIVFAVLGSVAAGQLGQSLRLMAMVLGLSNAWILTRAALYGRMISQDSKSELTDIFRHSIIAAVVVAILGCGLLAIPLWCASKVNTEILPLSLDWLVPIVETISEVPSRLGSSSVMIALACNTILCALIYGLQSFVRAHRKEPFIPNAIVAALTVPLITYVGAINFGLEGVAWGYFMRSIVIELPLTLWLFHKNSCIDFRSILGAEARA